MKLTTYLHLMPRSGMYGALPPYPIYTLMELWLETGTIELFGKIQ
jgi:hypothetical protein